MSGFDWNDPTTLWLNLTNLGLGLLILGSVGVLFGGIGMELLARFRASLRQGAARLDTGLHVVHTRELGLTMADGGEPVEDPTPAPKRPSKKR